MLRSRLLIIPERRRKKPRWRLKKLQCEGAAGGGDAPSWVLCLLPPPTPPRPPLTSQCITRTSVDLPPSRSSFQLCSFFFRSTPRLAAKFNLLGKEPPSHFILPSERLFGNSILFWLSGPTVPVCFFIISDSSGATLQDLTSCFVGDFLRVLEGDANSDVHRGGAKGKKGSGAKLHGRVLLPHYKYTGFSFI